MSKPSPNTAICTIYSLKNTSEFVTKIINKALSQPSPDQS